MAETPRSRAPLRALIAALVAIAAVSAPAAGAATTTQSTAGVTEATTGLPDASTLVPRNVCGLPRPGHASCLAQLMTLRSSGATVRPRLRPASSPNRLRRARALPTSLASPFAEPAGAPAPQAGTPAYMQQAYDLSYLSQTAGTGQTIAVVDAYDDPTAQTDLNTYRSTFGLPACGSGCFQKVNQSGAASPLPARNSGWATEIALDLAAVSALCPNCHIVLVEANSDSTTNLQAAQVTASHFTPTVISDSWGTIPATAKTQAQAQSIQQQIQSSGRYTFGGIATVAASGDDGYLGAGQNPGCTPGNSQATCNVYPAALPGVTSVGGTTLVAASGTSAQGARGFSETAWSGTGSGCDTTETKPSWQADTGCAGRAYNDISAAANPDTGLVIYDNGNWELAGGTSVAAPLVAAYYALVGAGSDPSWAYRNSGFLNDPSSGSNGTCATQISYICSAIPAFDGPTGVGTISGAVTTGAPGIGGPGPNGGYLSSLSYTTAGLQGGVYPNGQATSYWWEYGTTKWWENSSRVVNGPQTAPVGIGSGKAPVSVTDTLTGLKSYTTYYYRLVARSTNAQGAVQTVAGYDFSFTTDTTYTATPAAPTTTTTPTSPTTATTTPISPTGTAPPPTSHAPQAPGLGGLRIVSLGSGNATVSETVNTGGAATAYYLAYGTTPKLSHRTSIASTTKSGTVTWRLSGLTPGRVYYLQAAAANGGGARSSSAVRVKTSPVTVGKITARGGKLQAALRCRGSARCSVRLTVKIGKQVIASGNATVRGNHSALASLTLNRAAAAHAAQGKSAQATLSVVSVWNGYPATVGAKFRLNPRG